MSRKDFRIVVCSMPHREELISEIYYKNEHWVEISAEQPYKYVVQFFNKDSERYWEFSCAEAMDVLEEAKNRLAKLQRTPKEQAEYDAMKKEQENWNPTAEEKAEYERQMKEQWEKYYG